MSTQNLSTLERVYPPRKYSILEIPTRPGAQLEARKWSNSSSSGDGQPRRKYSIAGLYDHNLPIRKLSGNSDYGPRRKLSTVDHNNLLRLSPRRVSAVQRTSLIGSIEESPLSSPKTSVCSNSRKISLRMDSKISIPTKDSGTVDLHLDLGDIMLPLGKRGRSASCYGAYLPHAISINGDVIKVHQREPEVKNKLHGSFSQQVKHLKNLLVLAASFACTFTGFHALRCHHSSLTDCGVTSLATFYASMAIGGFFSSVITTKLKPKWTIVISFIFYSCYFSANLHPTAYTMMPTSVLSGLMSGPLWNAQTLYLYSTSRKYAFLTEEAPERILNRFNRIFSSIFHSSLVIGNLISFLVYSQSVKILLPSAFELTSSDNQAANLTSPLQQTDDSRIKDVGSGHGINLSCGAYPCTFSETTPPVENMDYILANENHPLNSGIVIVSVFIGCGLLGIALSTAMLDRLEPNIREPPRQRNLVRLLIRMSKTIHDGRVLCLSVLMFFTGVEQGFLFADFTKSFVFCALGVADVGKTMLCFGITAVASVITISHVTKHINRLAIISAGTMFHACLLLVLWLWKPDKNDQPVFYVIAAGWALCDVIWNSQIYNVVALLMSDIYESAYNAYYMFQALGLSVAFAYSPYLCIQTKILIMGASLGAGLLIYAIIELRIQKLKSEFVTTF